MNSEIILKWMIKIKWCVNSIFRLYYYFQGEEYKSTRLDGCKSGIEVSFVSYNFLL